ncbi:MAG: B-box zinc finger protein [Kangiellaceae bacterium]|nr:B-box zinc finger protein [Kangiellaceae bacterium]
MEYCKYHPASPATYHCGHCKLFVCDPCVDEGGSRTVDRCFKCGNEIQSLGATHTAKPFWRRLEQSFRYPLNASTISLVVAFSVLQSVFAALPLGFIVQLALFGGMIKYAFDCLEKTSSGELVAPDISSAYSGGLGVAFQVILIILGLAGMVFATGELLGEEVAMLVGFFFLFSIPAVLINFGISRNVIDAINPLKMFQLITSIGLPYGLIIGFLLIMSASVGVINQFFGDGLTFLSSTISSMVSNYYMIVMFHLMGYMIFQYQSRLGFVARESSEQMVETRPEEDKTISHISMLVKDGEYESANKIFLKAFKKHPNALRLKQYYYEFLIAIKNKDELTKFADDYLNSLIQTKRSDKLVISYKQILTIIPDHVIASAKTRYLIAKASHAKGEHKLVLKLVNGMKAQFPDFPGLADAYELLVDSLRFFPKLKSQQAKFKVIAEQLRELQPKSRSGNKAEFIEKSSPENQAENKQLLGPEEPENKEVKELPPLEFKL